jgi:hypothetical protein
MGLVRGIDSFATESQVDAWESDVASTLEEAGRARLVDRFLFDPPKTFQDLVSAGVFPHAPLQKRMDRRIATLRKIIEELED